MGKLKLSENLFLEVAELNRFRQFMEDDGWKRVLKTMIKSTGIVQDEQNTGYKVMKIDNAHVSINPGIAFDSNLNAIVLPEQIVKEVVNNNVNKWLILRRAVHNFEKGSVAITQDGTITGTNTEFTKVLRGQPNFPTKIKFNSEINSSEYEVVQVNDDATAIVAGAVTAESGLKYSVVGTFTPGYIPSEENKLIYEFDSCEIYSVDSISQPTLNPDEYLIARLTWDEFGVLSVSDERASQMFNSDYNVNQQSSDGVDFLANLVQATVVSGINAANSVSADIELILEHGYSIASHQLEVTESANMFKILSGSNNFLQDAPLPTDSVNGWVLVNRSNMKKANILNNVENTLYLDFIDSDLVLEDGNDFVVVPPFKEIEYEITLSSNVAKPGVPFIFRNSISTPFTRARFYASFPQYGGSDSVDVKVQYRMIGSGDDLLPYKDLAVSTFINVQGETESIANSEFSINLRNIEPVANQRNYS